MKIGFCCVPTQDNQTHHKMQKKLAHPAGRAATVTTAIAVRYRYVSEIKAFVENVACTAMCCRAILHATVMSNDGLQGAADSIPATAIIIASGLMSGRIPGGAYPDVDLFESGLFESGRRVPDFGLIGRIGTGSHHLEDGFAHIAIADGAEITDEFQRLAA